MGSSLVTSHGNGGSLSFLNSIAYIEIAKTSGYNYGNNTIITLEKDFNWVIIHNIKTVTIANTDLILVADGVGRSNIKLSYYSDSYYKKYTYITFGYSNRTITALISGEDTYSGNYQLNTSNLSVYLSVY